MDLRTRRFLYYAGHRVSLLRLPTHRTAVLGTARPDDTDPRLRVLEQAGIAARSPRAEDPATIDQALPPRVRTALSYTATGAPTDHPADETARRARHIDAHRQSTPATDPRRAAAARGNRS